MASEVVSGLQALQTLFTGATEAPQGAPPALSVARVTPILESLKKGLSDADRLSDALKDYDTAATAKDRRALAVRIRTLLAAIGTAMRDMEVATLPPKIGQQASALVAKVNTTTNAIRVVLSKRTR